jgi:soluble epoxide hydrolase / lipid-phosphate phosphatase
MHTQRPCGYPYLTYIQDKHMKYFKAGGWRAPTNWYKSIMQGTFGEGDKGLDSHSLARSSSHVKIVAADILQDGYKLTLPVLIVATLQDAICLPELARRAAAALCTNATVHDIDTGHWAMLEKPDEINALIDGFLTGL